MKVLKREAVSLAKLQVPGEVAKLARDPTLADMRFSLSEVGMIHPVVYRQSDQRLLAGRRRIASAIRLGMQEVPVTWVDCTDREAEIVEHSENAYRIHDRSVQSEAIAKLVRLRTRELEVSGAHEIQTKGRRRTAHAAAVSEVAAATGRSEKSVRAAEGAARRRKERKERATVPKPKPEPRRLELKTLGVEPDPSLYEHATKVNAILDKVLGVLEPLHETLTELGDVLGNSWVQEWPDLLEASRPYSVCPYCKSLDGIQQSCQRCNGRGWSNREIYDGAPKKLLDESDPYVVIGLEMVSAFEAIGQQEEQDVPDWTKS